MRIGLIVSFTILVGCHRSSPEGAREAADSTGTPIVGLADKCLDDNGSGTDDGNKIQLWTCNGTAAQAWRYSNGALVGIGGKCLDVPSDNQVAGTAVQLYDCNGTAAQQWTIDGTQLRSSGGLCLDVWGNDSTDGTQVGIWTCNGQENQVWHVSQDGTVASTPDMATTPAAPPPPGTVPRVVKAFVGPWNGNAYQIGLGQYDCADPPWTKPDANRVGTDFSPVEGLLYLVSDHCESWTAWRATAPSVKSMYYIDPHRICTPGDAPCSERPNIDSLDAQHDLLQAGGGPLVTSYSGTVNTSFGDPGSAGLVTQTNAVISSYLASSHANDASSSNPSWMWADDAMLASLEYLPTGAIGFDLAPDWANVSFGDGTPYTDAEYSSRMTKFNDQLTLPMMNEGLCNGSGADALGTGDAHDPTGSIEFMIRSQNSAGAMCESFGQGWNDGENSVDGKVTDGQIGGDMAYFWSSQMNTHIQLTTTSDAGTHPLHFVPYSYIGGPGVATDENDQRGYIYASLMLAYDPEYTLAGFNGSGGKGSYLAMQPEMGLVPTQPRTALKWPTRIAALQQSGGAYVREYQGCYFYGHAVGNCAFVVNPSFGTPAPMPALSGTYGSSVYMSGDGIFNGQWGQTDLGDDKDDIHFDGGIPTSLAAAGWTILVQNQPVDDGT